MEPGNDGSASLIKQRKTQVMHLRIRTTQAIPILMAFTIVAIVILVSCLLWDSRNRELDQTYRETVSLANLFMEQTEQSFDSADRVLLGVQERMETVYGSSLALDSLPVHLLLAARISGLRQVRSMFIIDPDGRVINSSREHPIEPIAVTDREYYQAFAHGNQRGLFVGKPTRSRIDNAWTIHLARPLFEPSGKLRGIVVAAMNIRRFEQIYDQMTLSFVRPVSIYLADGTLVASLPPRENLIGAVAPEIGSRPLPTPGDGIHTFHHANGDGPKEFMALGRVEGFPLLVSVTNDSAAALASWRGTAIPIGLGAGLVCIFIAFVGVVLAREVAHEAKLRRALREADAHYHRTIDSMMDAVIATDAAQNILVFNPAAERMFGYSASEMIGQSLDKLIPAHMRGMHRQHVKHSLQPEVGSRALDMGRETIGLRADGSEFPLESTVSKISIGDRLQLTAVLRDVGERHQAEASLRHMNQQLRELSAALENVREQERTRIARELHDELGQQLTGLKLDLAWLGGRLREGRPPAVDKVDEMGHRLNTTIDSVRRIATELRPLILDDLGFGEAIAWQAAEIAKRTGLEISLDLRAAALVSDDALAIALFRIVQESLTNVVRHAQASKVEIR
ncbi:MAG TPA: PAS domain S-box protein, partial [Burkholderiaceae bacterium]|nr:PAS domain S-box protein [Burkholderiaceae bacterium]